MMATTVKKRRVSSSQSTVEKTAKRRKRTYFSDEQLDQLEQTFEEDMFPGIYKREKLATELGMGEDRIHDFCPVKTKITRYLNGFSYISPPPKVWFQNRRSRLRKREIKNKPAPVTSPAELQASRRPEPLVPGQFLPCCHPSSFMSTSGTTHVPNCDNVWDINSSSYYFPPEFSSTNTTHSSAFTGPSFSFIYTQNPPPTLSQMTTEEAPWSDQGQRSSPLFYESDSRESRHSSDEYLAAMGRELDCVPLSVFLGFKRPFLSRTMITQALRAHFYLKF